MKRGNNDEKIGEPVENELEENVDMTSNIPAEPVLEDADAEEKSMDDRLAEILGQNKMYDEGNFSIMDIPEASEEEIENSIEESNKLIKIKHDKFLDFLNELLYRSKDAVNKYNELVDKQKSSQCLFYRCKKVYMNEIIHGVKHSGR